ncbi:MAG: SDR family NAD(P)-dependent oxidoreductase [Alphaproteobacteria bacterium]|nr:SDR family NAD(P)-dependent oxidoreductase [Alphaproteobacteria bacterium]
MPDNPASYLPRVVMITGATGGFGEAFAKRFAALGCSLILHGRNPEKLARLAKKFSVPVHPIIFDITDKQATLFALSSLPPAFGQVDVLINNAGGALGLDKAQDADLTDWEDMIAMNDTALVRITKLILPGMIERRRGHIINIGSTAGNYPYAGGSVYCASKAFVHQFSLALRADLVGTKIRVTSLEPGMAETPFSLARFKGDEAKAQAVYAGTTPLTADDVAETAVWVATLPPHVNVNRMEIMPTAQSFSPLSVERAG